MSAQIQAISIKKTFKMNKREVIAKMNLCLRYDLEKYDEGGGLINETKLANDIAKQYKLYDYDGSIPTFVKEAAHQVAEEF